MLLKGEYAWQGSSCISLKFSTLHNDIVSGGVPATDTVRTVDSPAAHSCRSSSLPPSAARSWPSPSRSTCGAGSTSCESAGCILAATDVGVAKREIRGRLLRPAQLSGEQGAHRLDTLAGRRAGRQCGLAGRMAGAGQARRKEQEGNKTCSSIITTTHRLLTLVLYTAAASKNSRASPGVLHTLLKDVALVRPNCAR